MVRPEMGSAVNAGLFRAAFQSTKRFRISLSY
jgi:hypothetical protein